jgi:hypothetical protein
VTKTRAIREKCRGCSGNQWKEIFLCTVTDCPLWTFRLGVSPSTKSYKLRIEKARRRFKTDLDEMATDGIDVACFYR